MTVIVPAGWNRVRLEDVSQVRTGVAKGAKNVRRPVRRPYLRVANVQSGQLDLRTLKEITVEASQVQRFELQAGDVLLTEGGDNDKLGRGAVWQGEIPGCLHQNHVFAVRPQRDRLKSEYLSALIGSRLGRRYFAKCSKQTTNLASVNSSQVRGFCFGLPPLGEQARIAALLGEMDLAVQRLDQLVHAKRRFMHGLMQELLTGKRRFKEFVGVRWKIHRLGDVAAEDQLRNAGSLPLDRVMAVMKEAGMVPMRQGVASRNLDRYQKVLPGWFAYNPMRLNIGSIARWPGPGEALVSPDYVVFHAAEDRLDSEFLNYITRASMWERHIWRVGSGSVRVRIYFEDLAPMELSLPSIEEQRAIAGVLGAIDREINLLAQLRGLLDRQRRGVAELLLTGKVRVPEALT